MASEHPTGEPLAAIIVNYHKAARVVENVAALRRQSIAGRMRVVVVDNSVDPAEAAILRAGLEPDEMLVVAPRNLGYSRGVNLGARSIGAFGDVMLINPDIVVEDPTALAVLEAEMAARPELGVLGTLQRNDDDSMVEVARRFPNLAKLVLRRLFPGALTDHDLLGELGKAPVGTLCEVDWVQSSFTLVRGSLWRALGGLDERYEIFMSDVALGHAAARLGYRVMVSASVCVRADGVRASRGSIGALFHSRALRIHVVDALKYQLATLFVPARPRSRPS